MNGIDINKSIEELTGEDWGNPQYDSYLVTTIHSLRRKPLKDFSTEDFRIYIGQHFDLEYLLPLALNQLSENPFLEGDFYVGDLLHNVVQIGKIFWQENPVLLSQLKSIIENAERLLEQLDEVDRNTIQDIIDIYNERINA